jgi:hypothetical protein
MRTSTGSSSSSGGGGGSGTQQQQQQQQQGGVAQISYEEAIAALQSMFEHIPATTLAEVLRANQWNMERTVESLLEGGGAGGDNPPQEPPQEEPPASPRQPSRTRGKPVTLPDDFLRVPAGETTRRRGRVPSKEEQLRLDEELARQLQQRDRIDARYQEHRRGRVASLPGQQTQRQRRPRVASVPGYPGGVGGAGRAASPAEEGMEKLGKALGQVRCCVCGRWGGLGCWFGWMNAWTCSYILQRY